MNTPEHCGTETPIGGTPESAGYLWDPDRVGWCRVWAPDQPFVSWDDAPQAWRDDFQRREIAS